MSQISPYLDPNTGDFQLNRGSIINKNTLETLIYTRLITPLGTFILDTSFGNSLTESEFTGQNAPQQIQRAVQSALKDLVTLGYVKNIVVIVPASGYTATSVKIDTFVTDNLGNPPQKFSWSLTT